tara:strand:+ start:2658 stop:2942 length:285 start_codon:yes stop_codon:yes gene_type:complete
LPLALHLLFASQAEAIQLFIRADVAEHGLHHRHAVAVDFFALLAIHPMLHLTGIGRASLDFQGIGDLPSFAFAVIRRTGVLHTQVFFGAMAALQ